MGPVKCASPPSEAFSLRSGCSTLFLAPGVPALMVWAALGVLWGEANPAVCAAAPIHLRPAVMLEANGTILDPGLQAIPCVADWNGDGLQDLLVGYRNDDRVLFYANTSPNGLPILTAPTALQAGGATIVIPGSGCGAPAPWVCDYDADGDQDLLGGDGTTGAVHFFRNVGSRTAPVLAAGVRIQLAGGDLVVGSRATPYVCDWDEDGLADLLCGDGSGFVHFFRNEGTAQAPVYRQDQLIQAGTGPVNFGLRSAIRVCDWDGDGLKDLIGSGAYNAAWCRNVGLNPAPVLEAPTAFQTPLPGVGLAKVDTGYRMRLEVTDWDQDGVTDLLIGDNDGYVYYYQGYRFALSRISPQPAPEANVLMEWHSAAHLRYDILAGPVPDRINQPVATNIVSQGMTTTFNLPAPEPAQFYRIVIAP